MERSEERDREKREEGGRARREKGQPRAQSGANDGSVRDDRLTEMLRDTRRPVCSRKEGVSPAGSSRASRARRRRRDARRRHPTRANLRPGTSTPLLNLQGPPRARPCR